MGMREDIGIIIGESTYLRLLDEGLYCECKEQLDFGDYFRREYIPYSSIKKIDIPDKIISLKDNRTHYRVRTK